MIFIKKSASLKINGIDASGDTSLNLGLNLETSLL